MGVLVTEKAVNEVKRVIAEQNMPAESTYLRVAVAAGGCSGFSYKINFDNQVDDVNDDIYEFNGLKVVVDKKSDLYLDGTSVDFHDGLERRGFFFNNPAAVKTCGCGSSFSA